MSEQSTPLSLAEILSDQYRELQVAAYRNDIERLHARLGEFVHACCPACGADDATFRFEKYRCRFVDCRSCATLYMCPRPTPEVMHDYYSNSENYAVWNKFIFPKSEASRREKICRPNLDKIVAACREQGMQRPHLLEIGPGFGTFAALAAEQGFFGKVTVVERTPEMAQACRDRGLEVIESSLEEVGSEHIARADVAVCFEVIEHVFEPLDFLRGVSRLLKPGGLFVFTCPNGQGFDTMTLGAVSPAVDTEHVNLFNTRSIAVLLGRAGFEVQSTQTPGRLDAELVRRAVLAGEFNIDDQPFLHKVLVEDFDPLGPAFQSFLAEQNLSGNMRVVARKLG
jgi:2-polyprenyl-3-methyl-5-hydroxy-6-metoxy-1,4-benzoquinol methylase